MEYNKSLSARIKHKNKQSFSRTGISLEVLIKF